MSGSPDRDAARADEPEQAVEEQAGSVGDASATLETLVARGDVEGLLELARASRAGTGGQERDLARCLACYREAATLGSAEAEYGVALFHLTGGLVPQDLKQGAARLRSAADGGYLPAKVYLANLYDLGIHFAQDSAKADVWYRSAARAAGIDADPASAEYTKAMADLGCSRHCVALADDPALPEAERARLLRKAKAYGYQLVLRRDSAARPEPAADRDESATPAEVKAKPRPSTGTSAGPALAAFFYASLFVAASIGAGFLVTLGAGELAHRGIGIPLLADHPRALFPAVVVLLGVLPALLTHKAIAVARASAVGALLAGAGYVLWTTTSLTLMPDRDTRAILLGAAGFLAALLVLGLSGGTRRARAPS